MLLLSGKIAGPIESSHYKVSACPMGVMSGENPCPIEPGQGHQINREHLAIAIMSYKSKYSL